MKQAKFKKDYTDATIEKTLSFFRKRLDEKSKICNSVEDILKERNSETVSKIILHLNKFIKWYSSYYEKLPSDNFKKAYFKSVCKIWREKNNAKWNLLGLLESEDGISIATHISNLFAALMRRERKRLYDAK
jgi:hypothetical protein